MKNIVFQNRGSLNINKCVEGERLEEKIERIVHNGEPIKDGAPIIYTSRAEGVKEGYNIRTDRFEVACESMDKVHKSDIAKRQTITKSEKKENDGEAEPVSAT